MDNPSIELCNATFADECFNCFFYWVMRRKKYKNRELIVVNIDLIID